MTIGAGGRTCQAATCTDTISKVPVTDELLDNNRHFAGSFTGGLALRPSRKLAVVTCMDSRIDVFKVLGLSDGEAHILRNAGGVISEDVIRSLAISQRKLGTEEIIVIHHTDCGMLTFTEDEFRAELFEDTGLKPSWAVESFTDLELDVRQSVSRIRNNPFVPRRDQVRGFIYDVHTGKLSEVL